MKITVNYPAPNSKGEEQLLESVALFHATLIKEWVENLDISHQEKMNLWEEILKKYEMDN